MRQDGGGEGLTLFDYGQNENQILKTSTSKEQDYMKADRVVIVIAQKRRNLWNTQIRLLFKHFLFFSLDVAVICPFGLGHNKEWTLEWGEQLSDE